MTFRKCEHVDKALAFALTKSINGVRLNAEPYEPIINGKESCNNIRFIHFLLILIYFILDNDEYSVKATRTLYIGNLQPEISYNELREVYSVYGDIVVCRNHIYVKIQSNTWAIAKWRWNVGKLNYCIIFPF